MPTVKNNQPHVFSNSSIVIGKDDDSRVSGLTVYGSISTNGSIKGGDLTVSGLTATNAKLDQLTANNILGPALTSFAPTFVSCYNGDTVTGQKTYALNNEVGNNVLNYLVFIGGEMQPPDTYGINTSPTPSITLTDVPTAEKKLTVLGLKNGNVTGSTGNTVNPALCATDYAPIGTVMYFARSTPPAGWLVCDGSSQLKSAFPDLAGVLGDTFGTSTTTTFELPDLRGEFIRGWSNGRAGVDTGRTFGDPQLDELKSHTHLAPTFKSGTGGTNSVAPDSQTLYDYTNAAPTAATGGTETRPRNVALLPCIKAFHSYALNSVPANIATITNNYVTKSTANKFVTTDNFLNSKETNGYQKLPGGIMLQWGKVTDSNLLSGQQPAEFDFHISFGTTCYNLNCTIINDSVTNQGGNGHDNFIQIMTLQKDKFKVIKQEAGGGDNDPASFYWFAIGDY